MLCCYIHFQVIFSKWTVNQKILYLSKKLPKQNLLMFTLRLKQATSVAQLNE